MYTAGKTLQTGLPVDTAVQVEYSYFAEEIACAHLTQYLACFAMTTHTWTINPIEYKGALGFTSDNGLSTP